MSIVNTKYTTLCIDQNIKIVLESTTDIDLIGLNDYIQSLKKGFQRISIPIGSNLEIDLAFNMIIVKKGYKIQDGYFVSSLGTSEFIIKHQLNTETIITLLEYLYHLLVNYY
jgi:hypothetical protein